MDCKSYREDRKYSASPPSRRRYAYRAVLRPILRRQPLHFYCYPRDQQCQRYSLVEAGHGKKGLVLIAILALGSYIGFLGIIWFTWLQVTLFDIRFARDSIFERICKALQLGAMVGFASAGSRFTTRVRGENVWAFQSLSLILAGSRALLAIQYTVNVFFVYKDMKPAARGLLYTASVLWLTTILYIGVRFPALKL